MDRPITGELMVTKRTPYGFGASAELPFAEAISRTHEALAAEGFGVLTEINASSVLREKLGVELRPYAILGACNPSLAYQALGAEPDVGLLLPCNVVVYAADEPGYCIVAALDPRAALSLSGNPALGPLADEAAARLQRAISAVTDRGVRAVTRVAVPSLSEERVEEIC